MEKSLNNGDLFITNMVKEYSRTTGCTDANEIVKQWLERRKKGYETEEKILSALLSSEQKSCIPIIAKQLKDIFDTDLNKVIQDSIEMQIEREKPHELQTPEKPAGEMRGKLVVIKTAISTQELVQKVQDAMDTINKVYIAQPDMQNLWMQRVNTAKKEMEKKIQRFKNHG